MFKGGGFGGESELAGAGAWIGIDVAGGFDVDVAVGIDACSASPSSFSSFFFFPNRVSIPMTVKRVQMGSRLVSWTSIRSTHT